MTLKGKEAWDYHNALASKHAQDRAAKLEAARSDALGSGKEPFDLAKLEALCDTTREGRLDAEDVRRARFEEMYYVDYPELLTLQEFAMKVEELNRWS